MTFLKQLTLVCFISACFFSCKKESKSQETTTYDQLITDFKERGIATGNLLVYENGKIIHQSANGLRSINPTDSLTLDSQFRLASVSKQFTGMAIMKLKEAGKLEYDQKVTTIIPEFPYDTITVRHLLNHVSGLADYERLIDENWTPEDPNIKYILGNDEIMKLFHEVRPELKFQPGEKWEYSNTGYLYLASIVEKVSGKHFREFLRETILDPVGMANTTLYKYQEGVDPKMPNRVFGYQTTLDRKGYELNDYHIVNDVRGDGGIFSTLEDLYKWNMALVNHTIISETYLKEAWEAGKLNNGEDTNYGFGWFLDSKAGEPKVMSHSGGWVGFGTFLRNEVDAKSGFVLLTNNSFEYFGGILNTLQSVHKGEQYKLPKYPVQHVLAEKILNEDIEKGIAFYHKIKKDTISYDVSEGGLNALGYQLLNKKHLEEALSVFKLNIEEHPTSANPYDSYGDALLMKGDSINALKNFKRCFEIDSTLNYTQEKVEKLEAALKK